MSNSQPRRMNGLFAPRAKKQRRPAGISRRRKTHFSFETLEPRQVMSGSPIVQPFAWNLNDAANITFDTTTTAGGPEAQQAALDRELWWYNQMPSASAFATRGIPNDPLFPYQWHLLNTGQNTGGQDFQPILGVPGEDINVLGAWNLGYTGEGVIVAVMDSGVQLNHPDLIDNINEELSFDALSQSGNGNPVISMFHRTAAHGTAVAGLIGAVANNGIGGAGVAPGVDLAAVRLVDFGQTNQAVVDAFRHTIFTGIDITNNSWGPQDVRAVQALDPEVFLALRDSVIYGREGKGVIHVWAAGNGGGPGAPEGFPSLGQYDTAAYDGFVNSRYVIGVTGVDHDGFYNNEDGTITAYPEIGPNVLVAAPTGSNAGIVIANDTGLGSGLWTTDLTGDFGFNAVPDVNGHETNDASYPFDRDFLANADYTSRMNGTSAAAPIVSGVIALMLEANPELTWRDVQEILVRSARMNAPFGIPQEGQSQGTPITQSTWIVNQIPIYHDLEFAGGRTNAQQQTLNPIQDPNFIGFGEYHVAAPHMMTNGAGYTVSQGRGAYGEMVGYGHGVVDAELAVRLAEQWHTKNQALPQELSFTSFTQIFNANLPAAEQGSRESGFQLVPGGIGGRPGFIGLYNELFVPDPNFDQDFASRGLSSIEFNVPANQTMSVENVEVKISVSGDGAEALDHLRILLISPDGTHSEMNNFWYRPTNPTSTIQPRGESGATPPQGDPGSLPTAEGGLIWTFRTTRSWGERSDDRIVFDPVTGMPAIDENGIYREPTIDPDTGLLTITPGQAMTQGWRVVIENWGDTTLGLTALEMAFHGRPVNPESQRISGAIGIDENGDDDFNFSRMIRMSDGGNFGSVFNIPDIHQEDFAENITVVARRVSDNQVAARFVTGHDGNFYFDLVPDEYIISIEDPLGRPAADDSLTPDGLLDHYRAEWHITPEHFKVWQKQGGLGEFETPVDANGVPIPWLDGNGEEQVYGISGVNFLLDPGDAPPDQVSFSGTVYADANGDGVFNGSDAALPNVTVYVDANRNGALDAGETSVVTDASGKYTVVELEITDPTVLNVGVVPPAHWSTTNPDGGLHTQLVDSGEVYANLNFMLRPPSNNAGGGGVDQPGFLLGSVFEDLNGDGQRNGLETGAEGVVVYIDANNNGTFEDGQETSTTTNAFGAYSFGDVAPGQHFIRVDIASPLAQTTPTTGGGAHVVNLVGSSTISGLNFGYFDLAVHDFGDLPNSYELRPDGVLDPAHHKKSKYWLGSGIDGELTRHDSPNADGDDLNEVNDENGVVFVEPIVAGNTARIQVTASTYTTYLQGWIDWNNDGDFLDDGERVIADQLLVAGDNFITIAVPESIASDSVFARFRMGEFSTHPMTGEKRNTNTPFGFGGIGEVEDYLLQVADTGDAGGIPGDFDQDGDADGRDFLSWQLNLGKTTGASTSEGDADGDGDVDVGDLGDWQSSFGASGSSALAGGLEATTAALSSSPVDASVASWSLSTAMSSEIGTTAQTQEQSARRGLDRVAGRLANLADRLEAFDGDRAERAADRLSSIAEKLAERFDGFELSSLRRDSAIDALFGSSDGGLDELAADLAESSVSDAAFAELGGHFGRRRR